MSKKSTKETLQRALIATQNAKMYLLEAKQLYHDCQAIGMEIGVDKTLRDVTLQIFKLLEMIGA